MRNVYRIQMEISGKNLNPKQVIDKLNETFDDMNLLSFGTSSVEGTVEIVHTCKNCKNRYWRTDAAGDETEHYCKALSVDISKTQLYNACACPRWQYRYE